MANFHNFIAYNKFLGLQAQKLFNMPVWQTATRPLLADTSIGSFGYNTDLSTIEWYDGAVWVQPSTSVTPYTDEQAQDAVGYILSNEFTYSDPTPSISINTIDAGKITGSKTSVFISDFISTVASYVTAQKGIANGITPLGADSKVPSVYLPPATLAHTYVVASQAAMLALPAIQGDIAVRTDLNKNYILQQAPASTLANWIELLSPGAPVTSVNSLIGAVNLTTTNISEGTNLYWTQARFDSAFAGKSTTNLTEGTNLYWTQTRFNTAFAAKTTDNLTEGTTNLYFSNERVDDRVAALILNGTGLSWTYNDVANTLTGNVQSNTTTQKIEVAKAASVIGTRKRLNLIEGTNVTMTLADNAGTDSVDVTINASPGAVGSVTSVGASVSASTALTVSGSPITTSGTLAFAWAGASTDFVHGDGSYAPLPNSGNYIFNQLSTPQTADFHINGTGRANTSFKANFYESTSGSSKIRLGRASDAYMNVYLGNDFNRNINFAVISNTAYFQALGENGSTWNNVVFGGLNTTGAQPHIDFGFGTTGQHRFANTGNMLIGTFTDNGVDVLQINGTAAIAGLASGGTAPTTTGTTKMVVTDTNGRLSFQNTPAGVSSFGFSNGNGFTGTVFNPTTAPVLALSLQDAAADSTTKGQATFASADFNSISGLISIDYTNAQKATATQPGFLTQTDWGTFNTKLNNPFTAFGDVLYANTGGSTALALAGNTTTTKKFLSQTGTGSAANAPAWGALVAADIPDLSGSYIKNQTSIQSSSNFNISGNGVIGGNLTLVTGTSGRIPYFSTGGLIQDTPTLQWTNSSNTLSVVGTISDTKTVTDNGGGNVGGSFATTTTFTSNISQSSGSVYSPLFGLGTININADIALGSACIFSAATNVLRVGSAGTGKGTVGQSTSRRAISANAVMLQLDTVSNSAVSSVDHAAGMQVFSPQATNGSGVLSANLVSVINYYGLLIGDSSEYANSSAKITNRFGIWQGSTTDKNVYYGKSYSGQTVSYDSLNPTTSVPNPTSYIDINSVNGFDQFRMRTTYTPTSSSDTNGNTGDVAWDVNFLYIKTGSGWKRTPMATF